MSKIAVITGATGGIGRKNALELGRMGYTVIINGIDDAQAKECISLLEAEKITCEYMNFNVCDEEAMDKGIKAIGEKYGVIDVLVNNAGGLGGRQRFEEMETSFFRNVMALNLDSAFFASRAAIPYLKKSTNNPCIINFCSNASYNGGGPGAGIYGVSKGGVLLLTRALAKDLAEYGIRVNAVSPGTIDTDFHANIKATKPEVFDSWKNNILMKRLGQPEEVASVVGFLVSEKASFLTGEVIQINGGQDFM